MFHKHEKHGHGKHGHGHYKGQHRHGHGHHGSPHVLQKFFGRMFGHGRSKVHSVTHAMRQHGGMNDHHRGYHHPHHPNHEDGSSSASESSSSSDESDEEYDIDFDAPPPIWETALHFAIHVATTVLLVLTGVCCGAL